MSHFYSTLIFNSFKSLERILFAKQLRGALFRNSVPVQSKLSQYLKPAVEEMSVVN